MNGMNFKKKIFCAKNMKEFKTRIVLCFVLQVSEEAWRQCLAELEIVNWTDICVSEASTVIETNETELPTPI